MSRPPTRALKRHSASALIAACIMTSAQAATLTSSTYSVATVYEENIDSTLDASSGLITSQQTIDYNNNQNGQVRAAGTELAYTNLGGGNFTLNAGDISPSNSRPPDWPLPNSATGPFGGADANITTTVNDPDGTLAKRTAGSSTVYTVTFDLLEGEVKEANLWLNYTIEISNGNNNSAEVSWALTDPNDHTISGVSGSDLRLADVDDTINIGELSTIIDEAGTYTLTLTALVPEQEFNNANKSASATLDAVRFEVIAVPEPASSSLLMLGLCSCLLRRRRA